MMKLNFTALLSFLLMSSFALADTPPIKTHNSGASSPVIQSLSDLMLLAQQSIQKHDLPSASALLKKAVQLYPEALQPTFMLAEVSVQMKDYPTAVFASKRAVQIDENNAGAYGLLSQTLSAEDENAQARTAVEHAISLDPNNPEWWSQLGNLSMTLKDYRNAQKAYINAEGLDPNNILLHASLGDVYTQRNLNQEALSEYSAALRLLDESPISKSPQASVLKRQIKMNQAASLSGLKKYSEAETALRKIIAENPKDAGGYATLGQVLDSGGEHSQAIEAYKQALTIQPKDAISWGNLGWAEYGAGQYQEAISSSEKALTIDKTLAYVRFNMGLIYAVESNLSEAQDQYQKAIKIASPSDISSGIDDVAHAMQKMPGNKVLTQVYSILVAAHNKAIGL